LKHVFWVLNQKVEENVVGGSCRIVEEEDEELK
jgi:hypothetical protein